MDEKTVNHFKENPPIDAISGKEKSSTLSTLSVSSNGTILNSKPRGENYIRCAAQKTRAPLDLTDWIVCLFLTYIVAILI